MINCYQRRYIGLCLSRFLSKKGWRNMDTPTQIRNLETIRVREIMIPVDSYPKILSGSSLREAIKLLEETYLEINGRKSLPRSLLVFDELGNFLGCVRRRDIMRGMEPKFLINEPIQYRMKLFDINLDPNLYELANKHMAKGIWEQVQRPVIDVTRPIEASFSPDDHIVKAMYEMVVYGLNLVPVIHKRKVVGVIRTVELFHELAQMVL